MAGNSENKKWDIDLNRIKAKERKAFQIDTQNSSEDDTVMHKWYAKCIKAWPLAGDPSDVSVYPELGMMEIVEVERQFVAAFPKPPTE